MVIPANTVAGVIARFLRVRGVDRIFSLCGGHIMPMWMAIEAEGIRIIDVRDERAAVHMAQAHAELTGTLGVAVVTAGPGVTNAITGIANAHVARAPVLVLAGKPPLPQENRGGLQDMDHTALLGSITRSARTVRDPALALEELDEAVARALGEGGDPGPAFLDFPTDVLRTELPRNDHDAGRYRPRATNVLRPDPACVTQAVELLWAAKKPLVISGRGARRAADALGRFLARLGAVYLDTGESRGLISESHPSGVGAMRGAAMQEADVVVTLGRRLDFQLAFGSPAIFGAAQFIRIADAPSELRDNRSGDVEICADPALALEAMLAAAGNRATSVDAAWVNGLRAKHAARVAKHRLAMASAPDDAAGRMHPDRLLAALQDRLRDDSILITDGGDFLSFCRVGLSASTVLDPGSFGCIGVGVPFGIAAALAFPDRNVIVATGDGAFGFNAIEIDTAVRHRAPLVIVVANNGAWQIEVHDQQTTHGKVFGTKLQSADHAAMARAFGMHGERVDKAEDLGAALDRAFRHRPALVDVIISPDAVSSDAKSGLAWVPDLQPLAAWDAAERKWRQRSG